MTEEPDDGTDSEPSDSSPPGSDEETEPELTEPEGPGPHDNDPAEESDEEPELTEPEGPGPHDNEVGADDADDTDTEDSADDTDTEDDADDDAPDFTNVEGLGPDTDGSDDDAAGTDESGDDEHLFEEYDPDESPEESAAPSPNDPGATPPPHGDAETSASTAGGSGGGDIDDEGLLGGGPDSDQEMPLTAHIEEMMKRLSVVFAVGGFVALTLLGLGELSQTYDLPVQVPSAVQLIDILWNNAIPGAPEIEGRRPRLYSPLELILTELKVTALAGLLVALPVFVYETYMFMRPGLYPKERRYYISAIPTSLILGAVGMAFSHFVIIPAIMRYFTLYTDENVATVAYGLESTFSLILVLMGYMAIIFQIPLFIMLAIMMGIVTRQWLEVSP